MGGTSTHGSNVCGKPVGEIVNVLQSVRTGDVGAAYGLVAQVGAEIAYGNPDEALALFRTIQDAEPTFSSDRERLDWARAQVVAAKALAQGHKVQGRISRGAIRHPASSG